MNGRQGKPAAGGSTKGEGVSDLITKTYAIGDDGLTAYRESDRAAIRALLLGHKIDKIADDHLRLDDGTVMRIVPNEGCGGCASGNYWISEINEADNIITAVDVVEAKKPCDDEWCAPDHKYCEPDWVYSVFVVVEDRRFTLFAVEGNDGNGYYGTGYELLVRFPDVRKKNQ